MSIQDATAAVVNKGVNANSKDQAAMLKVADMPRTLMGGTEAMRKAGEKYLPREPAESEPAYHTRLKRSTLFNAFAKTVADMTGKVFTKPIVMTDDVPESLVAYAENIDLTGRHLNVFAHDVFFDVLQVGVGFILADMPPAVEGKDGRPATLADEQAAKQRPYLTYIPIERMYGWKSTIVNGAETVTQIRIFECVSEPDGEFLEKEVEQIRVIEPGKWRTFRKSDKPDADGKPKWILYQQGTISITNKITVVPVYANRTGFMTGAPPFEKLAELNVAHWQSSSDQRNILHVARVPILFGAGFGDDAVITIGVNTMIRSTDPNAKLGYVEHTGQAIAAGQTDLDKLEFQMQAMGLQLLVPQPGGKTATGAAIDEHKENSPLAMMAHALQDALETALGFMAEYDGLGEDAGGEIEVNTDFGVQAGRTDLQQLVAVRANGDISLETLWEEMQRRDYLSESFDPKVEKDRLANEAPQLPDPGAGNGMPLGAPAPGPKAPGPTPPPGPA